MVEHEKIKDDIHEIEWVCINCEARVRLNP